LAFQLVVKFCVMKSGCPDVPPARGWGCLRVQCPGADYCALGTAKRLEVQAPHARLRWPNHSVASRRGSCSQIGRTVSSANTPVDTWIDPSRRPGEPGRRPTTRRTTRRRPIPAETPSAWRRMRAPNFPGNAQLQISKLCLLVYPRQYSPGRPTSILDYIITSYAN
jgi:hypothetical protein